MTHTPGPWIICDDLTIRVREWKNCTQMGDYRGCIIADLKPALGAESDEDIAIARPHARPETDANARLIAASPQLLEACKELLAIAKYYLPPVPYSGDEETKDEHDRGIVYAMAQAAIAAAEDGVDDPDV